MSDLIEQLEALSAQLAAQLEEDPVFGPLLRGTPTRAQLIGIYDEIRQGAKHVPAMLRAAGESMRLYGSDDARFADARWARFKTPYLQQMAKELAAHGDEESGHDAWLASDLGELGVSREALERSQPGPAAKAYIAMFWAAALSPTPVGVWGIAYVLESLGEKVAGRIVKNLIAHSQLPNIRNAVSFFGGHAESDVGHMDAARRRLRGFTDPADQEAVLLHARATLETWGRMGHDVYRQTA